MTCGVSGLAFIVFFLLAEVWGEKTNFMIWVGKNAILFFLCDQLLAAVLGLDLLVFIYPTATAFTVALGAAINIAVWSALAYLLNKKKIYLKIYQFLSKIIINNQITYKFLIFYSHTINFIFTGKIVILNLYFSSIYITKSIIY